MTAAHSAAGIARRCTDIASCPLHATPCFHSLCATFNLACCGAANRSSDLLRCTTLYIHPLLPHCLLIGCRHVYIECKCLLYFYSHKVYVYTRYTRAAPKYVALHCWQLHAVASCNGCRWCRCYRIWHLRMPRLWRLDQHFHVVKRCRTHARLKGCGWSRAHCLLWLETAHKPAAAVTVQPCIRCSHACICGWQARSPRHSSGRPPSTASKASGLLRSSCG